MVAVYAIVVDRLRAAPLASLSRSRAIKVRQRTLFLTIYGFTDVPPSAVAGWNVLRHAEYAVHDGDAV
jgi:hypothetical protein